MLKWKRLGGREKRTGFGRKRFLPKGNGSHLKKKKNVMKEKTKTARKETSVDLKNWGNENDLVTEFHE